MARRQQWATTKAGSKKANPWGFHDMHGLVYEFTSTIWHASHANENPSKSSPEFVVEVCGFRTDSTRSSSRRRMNISDRKMVSVCVWFGSDRTSKLITFTNFNIRIKLYLFDECLTSRCWTRLSIPFDALIVVDKLHHIESNKDIDPSVRTMNNGDTSSWNVSFMRWQISAKASAHCTTPTKHCSYRAVVALIREVPSLILQRTVQSDRMFSQSGERCFFQLRRPRLDEGLLPGSTPPHR